MVIFPKIILELHGDQYIIFPVQSSAGRGTVNISPSEDNETGRLMCLLYYSAGWALWFHIQLN